MNEERMELLIHYDTALPSSYECIQGGQKGNPFCLLVKKNKISGAK